MWLESGDIMLSKKVSKIRIKSKFLFLMLLTSVSLIQPSKARVFGQDDRTEIYLHPHLNQKIAPSIAIMVSPVFLEKQADGYDMNFNSISDSHEIALCKGQRFYGQPTASVNCTGFLVAPDMIMTAAHCITRINSEVRNAMTPQCSDFMWIFDYKYRSPKLLENFFPNDNIAFCKEVIYAKYDQIPLTAGMPAPIYGEDIALIKLDRKLNRPALSFANDIKVRDRVYTLGHPDGLPLKATLNGIVKSKDAKQYFTSTLDIFGGNSGGPVLNSKDQVTGVVVRSVPFEDYKYLKDKECSVVQKCSQSLLGCALTNEQKLEDLYSHAQKVSEDLKNLISKF